MKDLIEKRNTLLGSAEAYYDAYKDLIEVSEGDTYDLAVVIQDCVHNDYDKSRVRSHLDSELWQDYLESVGIWSILPDKYRWPIMRDHEPILGEFTEENIKKADEHFFQTRKDWLIEAARLCLRFEQSEDKCIIPETIVLNGPLRSQGEIVRHMSRILAYADGNDGRPELAEGFAGKRFGDFRIETGYMIINGYFDIDPHKQKIKIEWTPEGRKVIAALNKFISPQV